MSLQVVHLLSSALTPLPPLHSPQSSPIYRSHTELYYSDSSNVWNYKGKKLQAQTFAITFALAVRVCAVESIDTIDAFTSSHVSHITATVATWTRVQEQSVSTSGAQRPPITSLYTYIANVNGYNSLKRRYLMGM